MNKKFVLFSLFSFFGLVVAFSALADITGYLFPVQDGYYKQWVPKSGTTHYTQVDETVCNGMTDYVYTTTIGAKDSFAVNISSVPNGSIINSIDIIPCASQHRWAGNKASFMNVFYRYNGVNGNDLGNYALYGNIPQVVATTTFSNLNLVKTSTSTLEIGSVLTSGANGVRLGNIKTYLTYTSAPTLTLPLAPSNLTATSTVVGTSTLVTLNWLDNSDNESLFKIEKSTNGINFFVYSTASLNSTFASFYVVSPGTHYFRVKANNAVGDSLPSNTAVVNIP